MACATAPYGTTMDILRYNGTPNSWTDIGGPQAFPTVRDVAVGNADDPIAHRPEQRLDDDVAPQPIERLHRAVVALAHDRRRRRHPGVGEHRAGPRLVDRALDRARAVDTTDAVGGEDVQRVDAEDHLLQ